MRRFIAVRCVPPIWPDILRPLMTREGSVPGPIEPGLRRIFLLPCEALEPPKFQRFTVPCAADDFALYRSLRAVNPSPYMFFLDTGQARVLGSSPEMLVRVRDGVVTTCPIAGTRRRGHSESEDAAMEAELPKPEPMGSCDSTRIAKKLEQEAVTRERFRRLLS